MPRPEFAFHAEVAAVKWEGYWMTMHRSPNTGDMVFEITTPEDFGDTVTISLNDKDITP